MSLEPGGLPAAGLSAGPRVSGPAALDETNHRILQLLAQNGRSTMQDIASAVGRSESTVRERLGTMERRGIVMGYEAKIDWALVGLPLLVLFEGNCPPGLSGVVADQLCKVPNVIYAMVTTGIPNVVALVRARDIQEVNILRVRLASSGLSDVEARISLEPLVTERQPIQALSSEGRTERPQELGSLPARPAPTRLLLSTEGASEKGLVRANG